MVESSEVFEKHYLDHCAQPAAVDFGSVADTLGITSSNGGVSIPYFNRNRIARFCRCSSQS